MYIYIVEHKVYIYIINNNNNNNNNNNDNNNNKNNSFLRPCKTLKQNLELVYKFLCYSVISLMFYHRRLEQISEYLFFVLRKEYQFSLKILVSIIN